MTGDPSQDRQAPQAWDPDRVRQFVLGEITLGELEGIGKDEQYQMAEFGFRLLQQGRLRDAKKVFEGLVALDPRDAYFHLVLGSIAQRGRELEEAERCYSRSIYINPFSPSALANRGEVRVQLGRIREGVDDLRRAIREDPFAKEEATLRARILLPALEDKLRTQLDAEVAPEEPSEAPTEAKTEAYKGSLAERGGVPDPQFASDDAAREDAAATLMEAGPSGKKRAGAGAVTVKQALRTKSARASAKSSKTGKTGKTAKGEARKKS